MSIYSRITQKGYLEVLTGPSSVGVEFMYNPGTVNRRSGFNHGKIPIPGRSHPYFGGGSGKGEPFSFVLQLDADRGFLDKRRARGIASENVQEWFDTPVSAVHDLRPFIDAFKRHILPADLPGQPTGRFGAPVRTFLYLGSVLSAEVVIDDIDESITHYGPHGMNVLKATLGIQGEVTRTVNMTDTILLQRTENHPDQPVSVSVARNTTSIDRGR